MAALHTPVCDLLGCDVPVILAGMGGVARAELVSAVTKAGGFGFLGMVRESPELIRFEIERVRATTTRDFGVNLIPAATKPELLEAEVRAVLDARVPVVALFWDLAADLVKRLRKAGVLVVCQVGSADEAKDAETAGANILVAQGVEAGGHVRGRTPRSALLREVVGCTNVPVLAAGGMTSGRDLVEALELGAEGVVLGTALLATTESFAHEYHKDRIVRARGEETLLTQAFHVNWPKGAAVRVLENSVTRGEMGDPFSGERTEIGKEGARSIWLFSTDSPLKDMTGDFEKMALYAGLGCGEIRDIVPAEMRVAQIVKEAEHVRAMAEPAGGTEDGTFSSPVCYARETDDAYAGYATREELLLFLNELLEAERAGARITARSAAEAAPNLKGLFADIRKDEARWCAMLLKWIGHLRGEASMKTGAFYEKCLAIEDLKERAAFINRGQGWVARKLREMLPKVRDDRLHADLADMLANHETNIGRVNGQVGTKAPD